MIKSFKKWLYWFLLERMYGFKREGGALKVSYLSSMEPWSDNDKIYQLRISNPTDKKLKARILGYNMFMLEPNFGSDEGIVVENMLAHGHSFSSYALLLSEFRNKKSIKKIRIVGKDYNSIVHKTIYFESINAEGRSYQNPVSLYDHFSKLQFQDSIIDVDNGRSLISDGSMFISIDMLPNESIDVVIFEENK